MGINGEKNLFNQLMDALSKIDELTTVVTSLIEELRIEREERKKDKQLIEKQRLEIERLKTKNKKDSSNSSKPSSTNSLKKVITNRREPSDKSQGGQPGHQHYSLNEEKIEELISKGAEVEIHEIDKTDKNKNKPFRTVKVIDIKVTMKINEYRYYPDENGDYKIPNNNIQNIVYGNKVKALSSLLNNAFPNSIDGTKAIINHLTNNGIDLSKGTIVNWTNELAYKLQPEIESIENELLSAYYVNLDESSIKIDGDNYNVINA